MIVNEADHMLFSEKLGGPGHLIMFHIIIYPLAVSHQGEASYKFNPQFPSHGGDHNQTPVC